MILVLAFWQTACELYGTHRDCQANFWFYLSTTDATTYFPRKSLKTVICQLGARGIFTQFA